MAPANFAFFAQIFTVLSRHATEWERLGEDPSGFYPSVSLILAKSYDQLGDVSPLSLLGLSPTSPSSAPPTTPSLPQEELRLLRTSFDLAFASLAGQVKELAAKVNGSGPPPKAAAAKKPSAQPT